MRKSKWERSQTAREEACDYVVVRKSELLVPERGGFSLGWMPASPLILVRRPVRRRRVGGRWSRSWVSVLPS